MPRTTDNPATLPARGTEPAAVLPELVANRHDDAPWRERRLKVLRGRRGPAGLAKVG
jgi:hypothetical protein